MRLILYILVFFTSLVASPLLAQQDTTVQANELPKATKPEAQQLKLKPRLGLGVGTLVFYGDLGRDNKGYHPGSADFVYTLDVTNELTSFLDIRLYTVFGKININEYTNPRQLNMQATIRSGGASVAYNFNNFFRTEQPVKPFISIGFEAFEYLSKTDMFDSNGNKYHYWSDGSIHNLAESDPDAANSILLQRDYIYETDMRELNREGLGRFPERALAIPLGAGVEFKVTDRFKAKIGATYSFTLSDKIDHITAAGEDEYQGDNKNDRFLFSYFSLNYDLNPLGKPEESMFEEFYDEDGQLLAGIEDTDQDNVPDVIDQCPGTPANVPVDEFGCPLDSDGDGYPDYRDLEPNSPHTYVNGEGIAMDEDDIYEKYLMWADSIPWVSDDPLKENYAQAASDMTKQQNTFHVRIPRSSSNLSQEEINSLLALPDVSVTVENGEDVFIVGNFDELPSAIKRKIELSRIGIDGTLVSVDENNAITPVEDNPGMEGEIMAAMDLEGNSDEFNVHFRVQVGAFRYSLARNIFAGENDIWAIPGNDGLTRYITSSYMSIDEAAKRRIALLQAGFEGSFITAYSGGKRITLSDAGLTVVDASKDLLVDNENNSVRNEDVKFKVLLGQFIGDIPTEQLDLLLTFGNVKPIPQPDGSTAFMSVPCKTVEQAEDLLQRAKDLGITTAEIRGDFNGKMIPLEDALNLKN